MNAIMNIHLSSGVGAGPTELAAFDAALMDAGLANYNLLCLSSVIPPNARIVHARMVAGALRRSQRCDAARVAGFQCCAAGRCGEVVVLSCNGRR
jgi:pyruvoyl-dependent arginine decarboxylase